MSAPPLNYTTTIKASRTISECQELLARAGADAVAVMYEDRKPSGLTFRLPTAHGPRSFSLPVQVDPIATLLRHADYPPSLAKSNPKLLAKYQNSSEHARDVAWRIIKDWLEAQLALVAASMVSMDQVMLPYLQIDGAGLTLYDAYRDRELAAIEVGHG